LRYPTGTLLFLALHASIGLVHSALGAPTHHAQDANAPAWQSSAVEHGYGLPNTKRDLKGILTLNADGLTFTAKAHTSSLQRASIVAVSAGNQRVELWGISGRILRMAIPDGGGLAAAAFMHHRVDMLTVEFADIHGGYHGAVFYLPANEADRALQSFAQMPPLPRDPITTPCHNSPIEPASILVAAPDWDEAQVPAAYRALVYEHLIDRLQRLPGVSHVYRDGEANPESACPQYTIRLSITAFAAGSQVKRAVMGPVGLFVGTTQMTFDATFTNASGSLNAEQQIKATVRGESESTTVADGIAKTIAKHYTQAVKHSQQAAERGPAERSQR